MSPRTQHDDSANMAAPASDRLGKCAFFVQKKKRFCKMLVAKGHKFCGEHANMDTNVYEEGGRRRIACPLDPKHTVSEDKLDKHLKKCNSRDKPKAVYYVENINAGSADQDGQTVPQVSLCQQGATRLRQLLDALDAASKGLPSEPDENFLSHAVFWEEANNPKNGDSVHKHLKQQSSILGHLEALGLLGRGRCFVEFGAGRGKLSHWIHRALREQTPAPPTGERLQMLLVERSSTRFKVDGKHRDADVEFARLQVDIQHLDLSRVPLLERRLPLVGVGKHLCGAATDLALRCLFKTSSRPRPQAGPPRKRLKASRDSAAGDPPDPSEPGEASGPAPILGLAVALCCHHRCEWRHYVGRQFFSDLGLGPAEFSSFCRMSSWATCGPRSDEEHEPPTAEEANVAPGLLSSGERERIGRRCKLLIDAGRIEFLRSKGFCGRLTRYVSVRVTPENVLMTATPAAAAAPDAYS
ncbi:tRNA:m(4)X modification enzyme TRM13 homolog isoform X2 [Syngnathoides biaculeatus]|uniref:tRNA:m(4)X modification enzyme TRM13 homolog isoform X2 n=1 Tax=Syngnathoides biaculeatus TaxID=300417 RepID=UPI002ADE3978|nr:tRNA:m(4)X modification enzyme TRM13 homolog isoform X2 [Syngnathoides biaculeatus]